MKLFCISIKSNPKQSSNVWHVKNTLFLAPEPVYKLGDCWGGRWWSESGDKFLFGQELLLPCQEGRGGRLSQSEARTESRRPMRGRGRPVPLTVTLNAGMTEWGVLLQKSLDIKVAKTHIWRISSLWAAVSSPQQSWSYEALKQPFHFMRTSWKRWLMALSWVSCQCQYLMIRVELTSSLPYY